MEDSEKSHFDNVKLQMDHSDNSTGNPTENPAAPPQYTTYEEPTVSFASPQNGVEIPVPPKAVSNITEKMSKREHIVPLKILAEKFFCHREDAIPKAMKKIQAEVVRTDLDGEIQGKWVLTEIDHWDQEREKVVVLTDKSLLILRYDFVQEKWLQSKRVMLNGIQSIHVGNFTYPIKSKMPSRGHGGVKISFGREETLTFGQKWNPWCNDIPYVQFTHHPVIYHDPRSADDPVFNADDFCQSLVGMCWKANSAQAKPVTLLEGDIIIESYASVMSLVFNQSMLGFSRERGGVSF